MYKYLYQKRKEKEDVQGQTVKFKSLKYHITNIKKIRKLKTEKEIKSPL